MEKELRDIPERKKIERSRLNEHNKALSDAEEALKARQADIKKLELEAQSLHGKIATLRQQQLELKTNKEFKTMDEEIKGVERQISGLEDKELGLMEEMEKARSQVLARKSTLAEEDASVQVDSKTLDERTAAIQAKIDAIKVLREPAAKDIPKEWMTTYQRVFSRKDKALVSLDDGVCGGCHMKLPPAILHDTRKQNMMVICSYCGRMLYWFSGKG
jgi:uncharacterized protein